MSNLLKNLLIVLGLSALIFLGYMVFVRNTETDGMTRSASPEAELETQELLATLNELKSLNVNGDIFNDPLFLSLKDFRSDLGEEQTGRPNPFEPVR